MTAFEKSLLEINAGLMRAVAALLLDSGAKSDLLAAHLADLSDDDKRSLQEHAASQRESSEQLTQALGNLVTALRNSSVE